MMKCFTKESIITDLRTLHPDDPDFSRKFDESAKKLKEHIRSGHVKSKICHSSGKPLPGDKPCPGK